MRLTVVLKVAKELDCPQARVRPLCPTRFTVRLRALEGISNQLHVLLDALAQIEAEACDSKVASHANGLLQKMDEFAFHFGLELSLRLFKVTDRLSQQLQAKNISAGEGQQLVQFAVLELERFRTRENFAELWNSACTRAKEINDEEPKLSR